MSYTEEDIIEAAGNIGALVAGGVSKNLLLSKLRSMRMPEELAQLGLARYELGLLDVGGLDILENPDGNKVAWYAGPGEGDRFWPPVRTLLAQTLHEDAVSTVDRTTTAILGKLPAPGTPEFSAKGLVLGYVQSGKTTNFIGLAAKAADRGYKLIVILSGMTDILRNQTQSRIDDILVNGSDDWYKLTTENSDFAQRGQASALFARFDGALVAVVKKNPRRLRALRDWIHGAGSIAMQRAPLLLIDDEADQASIDVGDDRVSTINGLLREILAHPRSAYVAYTATPFANLLIDPGTPEDLYPRDFIVSMPRPDGYFGPERLFGEIDDPEDVGLDVIRTIPAAEAVMARPPRGKGEISAWRPVADQELRRAVRWFLLATAARRARQGSAVHASMLVHTSMLSEAHFRTREAVAGVLDDLRAAIATEEPSTLAALKSMWVAETARVPASSFDLEPVDWVMLRPRLHEVVNDIDLIVDNHRSTDRLHYSNERPSTVIVIGGNTLSRGLTLEGLVSSYFVRSASAYDTLLQMGRWFGYRDGYGDLCRIWITDELWRWFRDLSTVEQEIRDEISRYARERLTPAQMAVRIRLHPHLAITEAAKMRNARPASISFGGRAPQTTLFARTDELVLSQNAQSVEKLVADIVALGSSPEQFRTGRRLQLVVDGFREVPVELILRFLKSYSFHPDQSSLTGELLDQYIRAEHLRGSLASWRVLVMSGSSPETVGLPGMSAVRCVIRSRVVDDDAEVANIRALMSADDRAAGVDWQEGEAPPTGADLQVERERRHPREGILRLYPIEAKSAPASKAGTRIPLDAADTVFGLGIDFPPSVDPNRSLGYMVANVVVDVEDVEDAGLADVADEQEETADDE